MAVVPDERRTRTRPESLDVWAVAERALLGIEPSSVRRIVQ